MHEFKKRIWNESLSVRFWYAPEMNEVTLLLVLTVLVGVVGKCFNFKTDEQEDLSSTSQQQIVVDGLLKFKYGNTYFLDRRLVHFLAESDISPKNKNLWSIVKIINYLIEINHDSKLIKTLFWAS